MHTQLTILCIDDEQLELSLRKMVLEDAGYAVFTATNASKALEVFRVERIDLVITDTLQGITSHSFAGELRHLSPHLPIMVLSGGSTLPATVASPDYYLHKLDGPTEMIAKVQHAITGSPVS
jgi:two-component system, autoinducer 1 sensor kinase/phosphatase LuxN